MKRALTYAAVAGALLCFLPAVAGAAGNEQRAATAAPDGMTEGTVKKIDKTAGTVVIAHGPIANLGMGGMTMAFKLKNPKALAGLKEGGKVRFRAEDVGGVLTVVRIEAAD